MQATRRLLTAATSSSINAAEIAHFSRLSSQWWDERGEFSFLHQMNPTRVKFILDKVHEIDRDGGHLAEKHKSLQGLDILDVGCGGGLLSESLARLGARTLAIDASNENINIAKHHASTDSFDSLKYLCVPAESLLKESKRYDVVCSMEVIEHVDNPSQFLNTCIQLVKPSGHLFLSTMARTPLAYFLTIFMAEQVLKKVSPRTHTYSKYINPSEMIEFFQSASWISPSKYPMRSEAEVRGIIYNPLASSWTLGPRLTGGISSLSTECNYLFWARKPEHA